MLTVAKFVLDKWWRYLLIGIVIMGLYFCIFFFAGSFSGLKYKLANTVFGGVLFALFLYGAARYLFNAEKKRKKSLVVGLYNFPLAVLGLGAVWFANDVNISPILKSYENRLIQICEGGSKDIENGLSFKDAATKLDSRMEHLQVIIKKHHTVVCPSCGGDDAIAALDIFTDKDLTIYRLLEVVPFEVNTVSRNRCFVEGQKIELKTGSST
jgi:hypothetical protein